MTVWVAVVKQSLFSVSAQFRASYFVLLVAHFRRT